MKKALSIVLALVMLMTAVPFTAHAETEEYYKDLYFQGLADPHYTKTVANYDGYHLVRGTRATWDCKLYTLVAQVTGVSGSIATINVTFDSKIPYDYIQSDGWYGYEVKAVSNIGSYSFNPAEKSFMTFTVNTSKTDSIGSSVAGGMQFVKFEVKKNEHAHYYLYGDNPYYQAIANFANKSERRALYSVTDQYIDDVWALGYYIAPNYRIYQNNYRVSKNSITLGTYGYESILQYRVKGAKSYKKKYIGKNKKMYLGDLKANTVYQIWPLCKMWFTSPEPKEDGISVQKGYTLDQVASPFYLTTSITTKPKVSSVKISKFKKGKKKKISGYWESDGDWHPAETLNTATYTMKVNVKGAPKNAKGLVLKVGGSTYYAKGNKKSYTFKLYYQDKKKINGKKLKANFYWSTNTIGKSPLGTSPAKSASYKIKNGTYKVK